MTRTPPSDSLLLSHSLTDGSSGKLFRALPIQRPILGGTAVDVAVKTKVESRLASGREVVAKVVRLEDRGNSANTEASTVKCISVEAYNGDYTN